MYTIYVEFSSTPNRPISLYPPGVAPVDCSKSFSGITKSPSLNIYMSASTLSAKSNVMLTLSPFVKLNINVSSNFPKSNSSLTPKFKFSNSIVFVRLTFLPDILER